MNNVIGKCSICGGDVSIPAYMVNPKPSCEKCGAVVKMPTIEMERPRATIGWVRNVGPTCSGFEPIWYADPKGTYI